MSERTHLVFCATALVFISGALSLWPECTAQPKWGFVFGAIMGIGGLLKAAQGAWAPKH